MPLRRRDTRRRFLGATSAAALGALFGWRLPAGTPLVWAAPASPPGRTCGSSSPSSASATRSPGSRSATSSGAALRPTARKLLLTAADWFTQTLTLDLARDPDVLVATGRYGVKSVKWVTRIDAVPDAGTLGYWERQGWDDVAGVAFAGRRGIASVEVSTDGTRTWQPAGLRPPKGPYAWTLWAYRFAPRQAGLHVLAVRATDGLGGRQEATRERAFPRGSGGLHEVIVHVLPSAI